MRLSTLLASSVLALGAVSATALADHHGGGHNTETQPTVVQIAAENDDFSTLVAAVTAAGLVDALSGEGPFTVFAPNNAAFDALPAGTVETLLKPENKDLLTKVLTAHVVAGNLSGAEIMRKAKASKDGYFHMNTLSGDALSATARGRNLYIVDESGNASKVTIGDVNQSNGIIHVVNAVLVPK